MNCLRCSLLASRLLWLCTFSCILLNFLRALLQSLVAPALSRFDNLWLPPFFVPLQPLVTTIFLFTSTTSGCYHIFTSTTSGCYLYLPLQPHLPCFLLLGLRTATLTQDHPSLPRDLIGSPPVDRTCETGVSAEIRPRLCTSLYSCLLTRTDFSVSYFSIRTVLTHVLTQPVNTTTHKNSRVNATR